MERRSLRHRALLAAVLIGLGCAEPPAKGPSRTLTTHPHALDRYARLRQRELVDPDPVAVHRQVECEVDRVLAAFGSTEGQLRVMGADDSIHRTPAARDRFAAVEEKLYGKGFEGSGLFCDPLKAIANREEPIAPVDSAIRNYRVPMDSLIHRR